MKLHELLGYDVLKEFATGGGTSSASGATVANPFGITMRRPSLFGYTPMLPKPKKRKSRRHHK